MKQKLNLNFHLELLLKDQIDSNISEDTRYILMSPEQYACLIEELNIDPIENNFSIYKEHEIIVTPHVKELEII